MKKILLLALVTVGFINCTAERVNEVYTDIPETEVLEASSSKDGALNLTVGDSTFDLIWDGSTQYTPGGDTGVAEKVQRVYYPQERTWFSVVLITFNLDEGTNPTDGLVTFSTNEGITQLSIGAPDRTTAGLAYDGKGVVEANRLTPELKVGESTNVSFVIEIEANSSKFDQPTQLGDNISLSGTDGLSAISYNEPSDGVFISGAKYFEQQEVADGYTAYYFVEDVGDTHRDEENFTTSFEVGKLYSVYIRNGNEISWINTTYDTTLVVDNTTGDVTIDGGQNGEGYTLKDRRAQFTIHPLTGVGHVYTNGDVVVTPNSGENPITYKNVLVQIGIQVIY